MSTREVFIHANGDLLAAAVAARLITSTADTLAADGRAHLVLTGGGIGTKVLAAVAASPARDTVDWRTVDFWWGDERYAPEGDPDRNETGAREALFDHIPVDPTLVHAIEGPDGRDGDDVDASAARYATELAISASSMPDAPSGVAVPPFDVLMLGIGPEGHVASIFPESPAAYAQGTVVAVRNSPKPPPTRISLTFPAIRAAREVWILASGAEKAEAIARALAGEDDDKLPGRRRAGHPADAVPDRRGGGQQDQLTRWFYRVQPVNHCASPAVSRLRNLEVRMEPVVHENAAAANRLAELALTAADLIGALIGADQEARTWTPLAPPMMAGLARWGKTNELLRARLVERGWSHDNPKGLPRTISPARDFAIVATTGDAVTGYPGGSPSTKYAKGIQTVRAIGRNFHQLAFDFSDLFPGRTGGTTETTWPPGCSCTTSPRSGPGRAVARQRH